jgi:glycosyltransferase involved in cell wall biosynthesis
VAPGDPAVIHVGRLAKEKNYPLLFRAFDAIKTVEPRARLILVGDGPMLAACQKVQPDAVFTGFYTGPNLARHYASGDIYLHPSFTETFGNVVTEALASGLAVSAFDYAAAHEFIASGTNGLLARVADEAGFIANAVRLVQDRVLRGRLALAAPCATAARSWEKVVDKFATDLTEAIAAHHLRSNAGTSRGKLPQTEASPTRT